MKKMNTFKKLAFQALTNKVSRQDVVWRWLLLAGLSQLMLFHAGLLVAEPAPVLKESVVRQMQQIAQEKASRTPAQGKIDSNILLEIRRERGDPIVNNPGLSTLRSGITVREGVVLVDIKADVSDSLLAQIEALSGEIVSSSKQFQRIRAYVPLANLEELATSPAVRSIRPATPAITNKINTSQGDTAHAANLARMDFGVDGTGIKIGVLSDSVNALASLQASGDLPNNVTVLPGQSGNNIENVISEGTAMMEIVYDLAPSAQLFFATAFLGQGQFAQNILDLRNVYNCDIIVDDIFYFDESPFQDDIIAQAVNAVTADGALYFSSAGNSGNLNDGTSGVWEGDYSPTSLPSVISDLNAGYQNAHQFGSQNFNVVNKVGFGYTLFWSDPLNGSNNDYDLFLLDPTGTSIIAASTFPQVGAQDPFEIILAFPSDVDHRLIVARSSGENRFLHLNTIRGELSEATDGQTTGHSAAEDAFSVAAVDVAKASGGLFTGGAANPVNVFSSDGPRKMFFKADGTAYTPGNFSATGGIVRQKPDIAAADGVATATPGFNPFFGTSAAAPHAAAIAALLLESDPNLAMGNFRALLQNNSDDVRTLFAGTALDIEAPGVDRDSGYGIIMADDLLGAVACNPTFTDVPCFYWAIESIEAIAAAGITSGCGNNKYCPLNPVTRAQMAIFLLRGINGGSYTPPPATGTLFNDVPLGVFADAWIEELSEVGITKGCGNDNYCPNSNITRAQMAIFLLRAKNGANYTPPPATGTEFSDVPLGSFAAAWIEQLAKDGITGGCGGGKYCPNASVNRDQMAVFLTRTFDLL